MSTSRHQHFVRKIAYPLSDRPSLVKYMDVTHEGPMLTITTPSAPFDFGQPAGHVHNAFGPNDEANQKLAAKFKAHCQQREAVGDRTVLVAFWYAVSVTFTIQFAIQTHPHRRITGLPLFRSDSSKAPLGSCPTTLSSSTRLATSSTTAEETWLIVTASLARGVSGSLVACTMISVRSASSCAT